MGAETNIGGKSMKKYSWMIVALLVALTFTFISCGADYVAPPPDPDPLEPYELGAFNAFGSTPKTQAGWATGENFIYTGSAGTKDGDVPGTVAKNLEYDIEKFHGAKFLDLEMVDAPSFGNVDLIWGDDDGESGQGLGGWHEGKGACVGGAPAAGKAEIIDVDGKKVLRINLANALVDYQNYLATNEVRLIVACYEGLDKLFKKATLQVSSKKAPFAPITNITLKEDKFAYVSSLKLEANFTPADATKQIVIWSIIDWTPAGGAATDTLKVTGDPAKPDEDIKVNNVVQPDSSYNATSAALLAKVDFKGVTKYFGKDEFYMDYSVVPPIERQYAWKEADPYPWKLGDTIVAADDEDSIGTVTIQALVLGGGADGEDYTQKIKVTITDVVKVEFTGGAGAWVTDVKSSDNKAVASVTVQNKGADTLGGYTLTYEALGSTFEGTGDNPKWDGDYSGDAVYAYFRVTLAEGKKLSDYSKLNVTIQQTLASDDSSGKWKDIKLFALGSVPTGKIGSNDAWIRIGVEGDDDNAADGYDSHYNGFNSGDATQEKSMTIDTEKVAGTTADVNNPYIVIFINAPAWNNANDAKMGYKFYDISLIPK